MYPGIHALTTSDAIAVVDVETERHQTWSELDAEANRISQLFRARGLVVGDHIALYLDNHPRYLSLVWGCIYAGLVYTPCSSRLTSNELRHILDDCGARALVIDAEKAEVVGQIAGLQDGVLELCIVLEGEVDHFEDLDTLLVDVPPVALPGRVGGVDMPYSSGTTGFPKGVSTARPSVDLERYRTSATWMLAKLLGLTSDSVYLNPAPLYHAAPLRFCIGALSLGCSVVVMRKFDPVTYLTTVERFGVTHTQVVPTMLIRMLKLSESVRGVYRLPSLSHLVHAAAPCPVWVKEEMISWLGPRLYEYYSGTEGNGLTFCSSQEWIEHPGTVGRPLGCSVHICDDQGLELAPGDEGTVYFEGPNQFEYHGDPTKTNGSRHPRGWSTLGDVGYVDEAGYLYLTDRLENMIISGGVNIYPQEIENVLQRHPFVVDVAVIGIPNDDFGEEVKAFVIATGDASGMSLSEVATTLDAHCRAYLADLKCPRSYELVKDLPRLPTGKMAKHMLKAQVETQRSR